jgi:hypothetical protein
MMNEYGDPKVTHAAAVPMVPAVSTLMAIIERAANSPEFDLDRLEKLLVLKERWDLNEARNAYIESMAAFKANPPKITKNKHVAYRNKSGGLTEYSHASHAEVVEKIGAALAPHGLSFSWGINQTDTGIEVTCAVTHVKGHIERCTMKAMADQSGGKSDIQALASAVTYLQRYTLLSATGMTSGDMEKDDDDGRTAGITDGAPEAPADAWTSLRDAAQEGTAALYEAWKELSESSRSIIATHHTAEWTALKAQAASKK